MKNKLILLLLLLPIILHSQEYIPEDFKIPDKYNKLESYKTEINGYNFRVRAKTLLHNGNIEKYSLKNLFDNNQNTTWARARTSDSSPILIEFTSDKPFFLTNITIKNGFQKSEQLFKNNHRIKDISIEWYYSCPQIPDSTDKTLKDEISSLKISNTDFRKIMGFTIIILNVYKGNKYNDLCISDINLITSDKPSYKSYYTWSTLKNLIMNNYKPNKANQSKWEFKKYNENNNYKLIYELAFYSSIGIKEAKDLLNNFEPESTMTQDLANSLRNCIK